MTTSYLVLVLSLNYNHNYSESGIRVAQAFATLIL